MTIDIIGAGIGGLTTAIALEKIGFKANIYEQAKILKPIGAGIILASNAMLVFRHLGLEAQLMEHGMPVKALNITDPKLQLLSKVDLTYFEKKYQLHSIAIHRGKLQQVLLDNMYASGIHLDHELDNLTRQPDGYRLGLTNGTSLHSKLLIGADGIHSKVRAHLFPESVIRGMHQVCWRGVTKFDLPPVYQNELNEMWGKGDRFAFVRFSRDEIYWYAVKTFHQTPNELSQKHIGSYFKDYPALVREIIKATPAESLHTTVMEDLKPIPTWYKGQACLLGDAAHATTPNMGQGACQSIVDAYVLAECLSKSPNSAAFEAFQKARKSSAHHVVNQSRLIGRISHWKNPIATFFRNTLLSLAPDRMNLAQLEKLFQLEKMTNA